VGDPTGALMFDGDYSQTGGEIEFDVDSDGMGGFLESWLDFTEGSTVSVNGVDIVLNFDSLGVLSGFETAGLLNIDTFFGDSGSGFLADFGNIFSDDTFTLEEDGSQVGALTLNGSSGDLESGGSATPEPGTLSLLLAALGAMTLIFRRWRRSRGFRFSAA